MVLGFYDSIIPRLLHLLCAGSHPFSLVTHVIKAAAASTATSHYCVPWERFSVRQFISFYVSRKKKKQNPEFL